MEELDSKNLPFVEIMAIELKKNTPMHVFLA